MAKLSDYGYFDDERREFVITRPDTPAPWINYISNGKYTGLVSHTGGGFSYYIDPRDARISRLRYNSMPFDRPGRYVYLREDDGSYWSLTWQPTGHKVDSYECRVGAGYQKISSSYKGISSSVTYFVPKSDDLEIWRVSLTNDGGKPRKFKVYSYIELCLGHALVDLINQPNDQHFNIAAFDKGRNAIFATKNYWVTNRAVSVEQPNAAWDKYVFFGSTLKVDSYDCSKDGFIGPWRSESNPAGIEKGVLDCTDITAGDACAALQSEVAIEPGKTVEFAILMGCVDKENYLPLSDRLLAEYKTVEACDEALDEVIKGWHEYLGAVTVKTPDENMNRMLSTWGMRQSWVTFNMNRNAGYYHGGLLFGVGMRDQSQDLMGPILSDPAEVRSRILELYTHQFENGSTLHNYFKLTGQGERTGHSDTPLWLPFALTTYLKETGDFTILDEQVRFQDSENTKSVLCHAFGACDYVISQLTEGNLPKFGPGDWNDTLDYVGRKGKGESVWVAHFLCFVLREMLGLIDRIGGHGDKTKFYAEKYDLVKNELNTRCWDGGWYIRGTRDDGGVIGSSSNKEGRIFMNAQSWAVISGVAEGERAKTCLENAHKHLATERGPKILAPAYRTVDPGVGLATRCVPGKKENGAIFDHVAAWAIVANAMAGEGGRAYEYYRETMPPVQARDPEIYKMEPYVYSEYVTSDEHPTFGAASHSWLTGSGVWMFRAGLDYILGAKPDYDGLVIDPSIPESWKEYDVSRMFRGVRYNIHVSNPHGVSKGVQYIEIEGRRVEGNRIPVENVKKEISVLCVMG
ncbi:MAG: glycosyl transferase family 36 [Abditibacteriota bacterium]|nr:glycosyl transferase family 36 [Abditibacteriota bacterium]